MQVINPKLPAGCYVYSVDEKEPYIYVAIPVKGGTVAISEVEIAAGFRVRTYDGIPLVVSTGMRDDLGWSGTAVTKLGGEATNTTTALVVVNKRFAYLEELTPMTMMPLATTDSQFDQFDIYWDGAVVLANTKGAALLAGIASN